MIDKERFCKYISDLQKFDELDDRLFTILEEFNGYFEMPKSIYDLTYDIVILLSNSFESENPECIKYEIDYFCFDLKYGKNYKPGMITEKDGTEIDFSTSEKLYEYLAKEHGKKC